MPLRSLAFLAYFFGSSAAALASPMIGLVCYIVLYHLYPQTTWWGAPLKPLGIRYSFICGLCLLIGTVLQATRLRFGHRLIHPLEAGAVAVFLAMLLSLGTGAGPNAQTALLLDKMGKLVLFLIVFTHVVTSRGRLWSITLLFCLMVLYLGHEARNAPAGSFQQNRLDGIGGPDFRESASLAIHLCALMPFVAVVLRRHEWYYRLLAVLAAGYGVNAILLCRARSAFVAAVAAGLMAVWYAPRRFRRWIVGSLVLASIGVVFLSDTWFWKRMDTIVVSGDEQRESSSASRFMIWSAAWDMFKSNPLGVGAGQFEWQVKRYSDELENRNRDAHNSLVLCAGELGVPGLLAYLGTLVLAWMTLNQAARQVRYHVREADFFEWTILANRLALITYLVAGLFVSRLYTEGMWWLILMPVCLSRAVENEIRAQVAEACDDRPEPVSCEPRPPSSRPRRAAWPTGPQAPGWQGGTCG
jgi:O-antigen ligase